LGEALSSGRSVFIPKGTYRFTKPLRVRSNTRIYAGGGGLKQEHYEKVRSTGRWASIILNTNGQQFGTLFDNCYVHGRNGIWLRGADAGPKTVFRSLGHPCVIWSEHGRWELVDSTHPPVTARPGVILRVDRRDCWLPEKGSAPGPSGHPAHTVVDGVRRVYPHPADGLALYVHTDQGDDGNDGRSAGRPWKSLAKAARLYSNTSLDIPVAIHVAGSAPACFRFRDIRGAGTLTLRWRAPGRLNSGGFNDVRCGVVVEGNAGNLQAHRLGVTNSPQVRIRGVTFLAGAEGALTCEGLSGVCVSECAFHPAQPGRESVALVARGHAQVLVADCTARDVMTQLRAESGASVKIPAKLKPHWDRIFVRDAQVSFVRTQTQTVDLDGKRSIVP
jgi:hypothetical protein